MRWAGFVGVGLQLFETRLVVRGLVEPEVPGLWANLLVVEGVASGFESEFDLAVVVALMPDHVLEVKERVVIVEEHGRAGGEEAFDGGADGFGAFFELCGDLIGIADVEPLAGGYFDGELRRVFFEEDETDVVHVSKHAGDGGAGGEGTGFEAAGRERAEEIDEDPVVAVPGIEDEGEQVVFLAQNFGLQYIQIISGSIVAKAK